MQLIPEVLFQAKYLRLARWSCLVNHLGPFISVDSHTRLMCPIELLSAVACTVDEKHDKVALS